MTFSCQTYIKGTDTQDRCSRRPEPPYLCESCKKLLPQDGIALVTLLLQPQPESSASMLVQPCGRARSHSTAAKMLTLLKLAAQLTEKRSLKYSYSTLLCNVQWTTRHPPVHLKAVQLRRFVDFDALECTTSCPNEGHPMWLAV